MRPGYSCVSSGSFAHTESFRYPTHPTNRYSTMYYNATPRFPIGATLFGYGIDWAEATPYYTVDNDSIPGWRLIVLAEEDGLLGKLLGIFWRRSRSEQPEGGVTDQVAAPRDGYDCPQIREMGSDYIEEELQGGVMAALKRHLEACENCSAFINTLRRTVAMMRDLPLVKAPDSIKRNIIDAVSKRKP